jgi:hypothetical protein
MDMEWENQVRLRAYAIWEREGRPEGGLSGTGPRSRGSFGRRSRIRPKHLPRAPPMPGPEPSQPDLPAGSLRPVRTGRAHAEVRRGNNRKLCMTQLARRRLPCRPPPKEVT